VEGNEELALSAREHFEALWREGDPWQTDTSAFEQAKYAREFELLSGRRYGRALEIGCGSGSFTRLLTAIADEVTAIDIADSAIERAREAVRGCANVTLEATDVMTLDLQSRPKWDLITLGDTVSSICWSHPFVQVASLAAGLFTATAPGGCLLVADACGGVPGVEHRPWVVRTFRDLFVNVGFRLEREELFEDLKDGVRIQVLMSVFHKPAEDAEELEQDLWRKHPPLAPARVATAGLAPDRIHALWESVTRGEVPWEEYERQRARLLGEYAGAWKEALLLDGYSDLTSSLLGELARYLGDDEAAVRQRCRQAVATVRDSWKTTVRPESRTSVEAFYDESELYLYDLIWWHTLNDDDSPLGYVLALDFARRHGCRTYLDFGCGVASGGILFARNGFEVTNADISTSLLRFSEWRLRTRGLSPDLIDLKERELPEGRFDLVTAMDTFEHLTDPVDAVERLWRSLKPGGFLFARLNTKKNDDDHPQHIVRDFAPTLARARSLGLVEVWRDDWVWGHQIFQRPPARSG
jgi:2-polyprenyl-3-methyl-5-hydroxy-6-metoxy-1,4-benzoquinol methylase